MSWPLSGNCGMWSQNGIQVLYQRDFYPTLFWWIWLLLLLLLLVLHSHSPVHHDYDYEGTQDRFQIHYCQMALLLRQRLMQVLLLPGTLVDECLLHPGLLYFHCQQLSCLQDSWAYLLQWMVFICHSHKLKQLADRQTDILMWLIMQCALNLTEMNWNEIENSLCNLVNKFCWLYLLELLYLRCYPYQKE